MTLRKRSDRSAYVTFRRTEGVDLGDASKAEVEADRGHRADQLERGERAFWAARPWPEALGGAAANLRLALAAGNEAAVSKYVDLIVSVARRCPEAERARLAALVPGDPVALANAAERLAGQALEDLMRESTPAPAQVPPAAVEVDGQGQEARRTESVAVETPADGRPRLTMSGRKLVLDGKALQYENGDGERAFGPASKEGRAVLLACGALTVRQAGYLPAVALSRARAALARVGVDVEGRGEDARTTRRIFVAPEVIAAAIAAAKAPRA